MTDKEIFDYLFLLTKNSHDPEGVVSACVVSGDKIIESAVSSNDGIRHAEDLLLEKLQIKGIKISTNFILYSTLEPCSKRSKPGSIDCSTLIANSGIKNIIFGARDPNHSMNTHKILNSNNINIKQVSDRKIIKNCANIFNNSLDNKNKEKIKPYQ